MPTVDLTRYPIAGKNALTDWFSTTRSDRALPHTGQMPLKYRVLRPNPSPEFTLAVRRFEAGLYEMAGTQFLALLKADPSDLDSLYFLRLIERRLAKPSSGAQPTLIWQFDPAQAWESDWLRLLIGSRIGAEVVDNTWSATAERMIVVDNRLVAAKVPYYRRAFERGCKVVLVHLSDESFADDTGAYRYCEAVLRNYRSEILAEQASIHFFPLGFKSGFERPGAVPKPAAARTHLWSFAGDAKKYTRAAMLKAMERVPRGYAHLTSGFGSADALSTDAYRAMLDEAVIAPCPSGWSNLETFRVYEALEAGCIPIVEQRAGFDYFTSLLGSHPMPAVGSWEEAAALVQAWTMADMESLRRACENWWRSYKPRLAQQLADTVASAMALPASP